MVMLPKTIVDQTPSTTNGNNPYDLLRLAEQTGLLQFARSVIRSDGNIVKCLIFPKKYLRESNAPKGTVGVSWVQLQIIGESGFVDAKLITRTTLFKWILEQFAIAFKRIMLE